MKKKILLTFLMVTLFVFVLAISISATTYNYYEDEATEDNLLYSIEAGFGAKNTRFELISKITGEGFAKTDANGTPLTWYVAGDDLDGNGDGVRNIIVKSTPTVGGVVGNIDADGNYTYGVDTDGISFSKKVVSVNFFGTKVKTLPEQAYMATYSLHTPGQLYQYCQIADGSYLLALYLPKTLTFVPKQLCFRSPVIVLEFEDNTVIYDNFGEGVTGFDPVNKNETAYAFSFCANLKRLVVPEGIETMQPHTFRECMSLEYIKLPSTMERLENDVFFHGIGFETVIFGENMKFIGYLNSDYTKVYNDWAIKNFNIKYMYVPNTVNTAESSFDTYRGYEKTYLNVDRSLVFFFAGTLEEARVVAGYSRDRHFMSAVRGVTSAKNSNTPGEAPVSYEVYIQNKAYYDNLNKDRHVLVYNVPKCVAFHDGVHQYEETNTYKDALTSFTIGKVCKNCGESDDLVEYAPVLEFLGYSAQINGDRITLGYKVNKDTLDVCPDLSYGILAVVPEAGADMSAYEPLNPDLTPNVENKVVTMPVDKKYVDFNLIINSFSKDSAYYDIPFVMCAYVSDGEKIDYLCHNVMNEVVQQEYATSITFKFIAEECRPKYAVNYTCDSDMGNIEGEVSQVVKEGDASSVVTAVPKEGYAFAVWSNGSTDPSIAVTPDKDTDLVAYFTPASTGLPVMTIKTDGGIGITTKDYYINCEITLLDTETGRSIGGQLAEIKGRGNSTWDRFDKKPYKFKFESKQNLFGYGKEKTWVLLADARDYSLVRNMLAYNTALSMSELGYTSMGQSVELYLNGEYRGVYYLCEQIQVKDNRVDITQEDSDIVQNPEDLGYLIEMDAWADDGANKNLPNYTKDGDVFVTITGGQKSFVIKDPEDVFFDEDGEFYAEKAEPYLNYIKNYLQECHNAMYANKTEDNYLKVCDLIDVKSFAQAYIIFDLFKNPDVNYSSVYYYKDAGGKLVCSPVWDFDMAVGNVTHKEGNKGWEIFSDTTRLWTKERNYWFNQLLQYPQFKELVAQELAANADTIRAAIAENLAYAREHKAAYEKNFTKWNLIGNTSASESIGAWSVPAMFKEFATWEEHLDYIENYLEESLRYLESVYTVSSVE